MLANASGLEIGDGLKQPNRSFVQGGLSGCGYGVYRISKLTRFEHGKMLGRGSEIRTRTKKVSGAGIEPANF